MIHAHDGTDCSVTGEPLVTTGPGGDYQQHHTPHTTGPQRRYEQAVTWSLVCIAIGAALMAALASVMNLWPKH